jgi:hypothetical protein
MVDKLLTILTNRLALLFIYFMVFVLLVLIILNSFYPVQIPFKKEYLYLLDFLVIYLDIYLVLYIWKTKDFILDSRFAFLVALNLLIYTPFYIILKQQKLAEQLSIWAYYMLVI